IVTFMTKYLWLALAGFWVIAIPLTGATQQLASNLVMQSPAVSNHRQEAPQKLREALVDLGKLHGISILFDETTIRNLVVQTDRSGNAGKLETLLEQLLKPHGLKFKRIGKKSFVILPRDENQAASQVRQDKSGLFQEADPT